MKLPIYLDYAATTPVDPRVADKMIQSLVSDSEFGNSASIHALGSAAKQAIDQAREEVAHLMGAHASEIIWTSGATEANNLALKGAATLYRAKGKRIITLKTEHPSILDCCQYLEKQGFSVTYLTPENTGVLDIAKLKAALREDTILVSIMHMNNETGVVQDIEAIAKLTAERGILFHVDAAQSAGKIAINLQKTPIDLMSVCAHKVYGPKGIGALYVRRLPRVRVAAQMHGGGQEQGMRSGTLATHQIVGMGAAFAIAVAEMEAEVARLRCLRDDFWRKISVLPEVKVNGDLANIFPGILNLCFPGHKAEALINALPDLAISAGSACSARGAEPSYVLRALGLSAADAACSLRISFGRFTTQNEVQMAAQQICRLLDV